MWSTWSTWKPSCMAPVMRRRCGLHGSHDIHDNGHGHIRSGVRSCRMAGLRSGVGLGAAHDILVIGVKEWELGARTR